MNFPFYTIDLPLLETSIDWTEEELDCIDGAVADYVRDPFHALTLSKTLIGTTTLSFTAQIGVRYPFIQAWSAVELAEKLTAYYQSVR